MRNPLFKDQGDIKQNGWKVKHGMRHTELQERKE